MKKLSKSTLILIILAVSAIILGIVLFVSMPESMSENFSMGKRFENSMDRQLMFKGAKGFHDAEIAAVRGGFSKGFPFPLIFIAGLIALYLYKRPFRKGRTNHSLSILDRQFAEGKISKEEYSRKRMIIEEEQR